jgi:hypothetical protein
MRWAIAATQHETRTYRPDIPTVPETARLYEKEKTSTATATATARRRAGHPLCPAPAPNSSWTCKRKGEVMSQTPRSRACRSLVGA